MARTGYYGFGAKDPFLEKASIFITSPPTNPSGVTYDTTISRTDGVSLKIVAASGSSAAVYPLDANSISGTTPQFFRGYLRVETLPATARRLFSYGGNSYVMLNPSGTLSTGDIVHGVTATTTTALTVTTQWYLIEVGVNASTGDITFKIGGSTEFVDTAHGVVDTAVDSIVLGPNGDTVAATYTVRWSDISLDDSVFPGAGKVYTLRPISDNARNGWTAGAGGTTNLWDAIDNSPPVGLTAASQTNTSQVKSATNSATDNYDINLATYTTAGITSGDTIVSMVARVVHGEEINTGTKSGAIKIQSNPAGAAEATFTYGSDIGAVGTYPSNWRGACTTAETGPTVTLGNSPVVRIGKRTATTRVVEVCGVALYVDVSTPSAQTANPGLGQLTLTGFAPNARIDIRAFTALGALDLIGFAPTVRFGNRALTDVGDLVLTGLIPTVNVSNNKQAVTDVGALALTGFSPTISQTDNKTASPGVGDLALAGFAPTIAVSDHQRALTDLGVLTLTGLEPLAKIGVRVFPGVGDLALTGFSPTPQSTDHKQALTALGALTLIGFEPTANVTDNKQALTDLGSLLLTGFSPLAKIDVRVYPDLGALLLTGFEPTANSTQSALTDTGALTLDGFSPTIAVSGNQFANTALGQLLLAGFEPTIQVSDHKQALTDLGALILTAFAPTIQQGDNQQAFTDVGSLLLTGFEPSISQTANQRAETGYGELILTGLAPTISVTDNKVVLTDIGILLLTGFAPIVVVASVEDPSLSYSGQFFPNSDYY